jgi:hypothetical protein
MEFAMTSPSTDRRRARKPPAGPVDRAASGVGRAIDRLIRHIAHKDPEERTKAVAALQRCGHAAVDRLIATVASTDDADLRMAAMVVLGGLGRDRQTIVSIAIHKAALEHPDGGHMEALQRAWDILKGRPTVAPSMDEETSAAPTPNG